MNPARASERSPAPEAIALLARMLARALPEGRASWLEAAREEIAGGASLERFCALLSTGSRHVPRRALSPSAGEIEQAARACAGWNPERWTVLEAARVLLVLSRPDLDEPTVSLALEEAFRYADVGEMCALHRSLQLLPGGERFRWRAGEGCRSSMRAVFEAVACDTGYPAANFDALAWRQLAIKALFVEAPLWRVYGLDQRLDPELARMALDLADERRSAGRPVQHELWLCLGRYGGERGVTALERELADSGEQELSGSNTLGRRAAAIAMARAGAGNRLAELLEREQDPVVAATMRSALNGDVQQRAFRDLEPAEPKATS